MGPLSAVSCAPQQKKNDEEYFIRRLVVIFQYSLSKFSISISFLIFLVMTDIALTHIRHVLPIIRQAMWKTTIEKNSICLKKGL